MYAPSYENDTEHYIKSVSSWTGIVRSAVLSLTDDKIDATMASLMKAIIMMEIGYGVCPYTDEELATAVQVAKIPDLKDDCSTGASAPASQ